MADSAPDVDRALWSVVDQIVKTYDAESLEQEWLAQVTVNGRQHRAGIALAVWYKMRWPVKRNDEAHYAGYYSQHETSTAAEFLAVFKQFNYDAENRVINFGAVRDQLDDPALLRPYFYLQRIIPLLNEKNAAPQVKEILDNMVSWLDQDQLIWFADFAEDPDFIVAYATGLDAQLEPFGRVVTLPWQTVASALRLFLPTEFCEYIRRNGEGRQHFMALLAPYHALADTYL